MRGIKAKIPRLSALSIFFSFALALFFFWLRVVALATGTSILLDVVLDQETLGLAIVAIGWLYAFFVIGTSVVSLWRHGEAKALVHIHASATSRLFWLGVVMLLLVLLFTAASMAAVSASIVVAWSVIYVAVILLLTWVQLRPSLKLPFKVKQFLRLHDTNLCHPSNGLMAQAELPAIAHQLCSAWRISQIIHDYRAQKGHAPWNAFYRESNPEVIALWVEGLQQALTEFLDVVVIVEQRSERNFASLYGCWDEFVSGAQRVWRPSRNIVTLDLCEQHEHEPAKPACAMSLRELFARGEHFIIDGLLRRFDKQCVAPYTAEALAAVVAQGSKKSVWKPCWVYSRSGSDKLTLLAFESLAGWVVGEGVLLPSELFASEDSAVELDTSSAVVVFDALGHQRFARLNTAVPNAPSAAFKLAYYTSPTQVYAYLKNYSNHNAYEALNLGDLQTAPWEPAHCLCDFINADGESLIPPATRALAGTIDDGGCVICNKDSELPQRQDWFSLTHPQHAFNRPLRWLKVVGERENRRAVQSPENNCWGYIDAEGELVIAEQFADWGLFHRGFAQVSLPAAPQLYGLINKAGEFVLSPQWLDLRWSSAKWVAVKNTQGEWGVVGLSNTTELMLTPKTLVPFESPEYWLALYEQQVGEGSYRPRVSWGEKTDEEKIVEQMEQVFIAAKQAQMDAAKSAASLASLAGLFDHTTCEKELASLGLWGMRVEVIAFAGCDQRHEKLVGQQGVIMSHYPVSLSTFDLGIEAPLEGLASYPNAVMGVVWAGLKWIKD